MEQLDSHWTDFYEKRSPEHGDIGLQLNFFFFYAKHNNIVTYENENGR